MNRNDAQSVTRALGGRWYGSYGLANCPAHNNTHSPALCIRNGDQSFLLKCFAGCTSKEVFAALPDLNNRAYQSRNVQSATNETAKANIARHLWETASPLHGSLGDRYLAARGLQNVETDALRFLPKCRHVTGQVLPALVAKIDGGSNFAIHRTYLSADGLAKANVSPNKMMLGPTARGAVRLYDRDGPLVVAEGIETALSVRPGIPLGSFRLWAALSTSGMKRLKLPTKAGQLIVAPDGDPPGLTAARLLADRAYRIGWEVKWFEPPQGQDWNDVLLDTGGGNACSVSA